MSIEIIDTPNNVTRYLPRLGAVHTIIRYITHGNPSGEKNIKPAEALAIKKAGKRLAIVHETYGDFAHAGRGGISRADGERDGPFAVKQLRKLGAPPGAGCYFAVDTDGTNAQLASRLLPYFRAVAAAFKGTGYRVGIYGPGWFCQAVKDDGCAELFWLANAKGWRGYNAFLHSAHLVQRLPTHIAGGLDVDPDVAQVPEWGQFIPFAAGAKAEADEADDPAAEGEAVPERLGNRGNDDDGSDDEDAQGSVASVAGSLFKSKIAWITGGLGGTGAATSITSDPDVLYMLEGLMHKPAFWLTLACIGLAGLVLYYRWKDHGRGKVSAD